VHERRAHGRRGQGRGRRRERRRASPLRVDGRRVPVVARAGALPLLRRPLGAVDEAAAQGVGLGRDGRRVRPEVPRRVGRDQVLIYKAPRS
jgi:hypothetical protein